MDSIFTNTVVPWLMHVEGLFSDDPNDRGGATKYGISLRYLQGVKDHDGDGFVDGDLDKDGDVDIDDIHLLTPEIAKERYYQDFWRANQCHKLPKHVALCLVDAYVNHRPRTARMLIQRALRVKPDGIIGPVTRYYAQHSSHNRFLPQFTSYRCQLYADIVRMNSSQAQWERGWYCRQALLQQYIQTGELD